MVARVLVGMDDSELAERALKHALDTYPDGEITVLHVVGGASPMMGDATSVALEGKGEAVREEGKPVFDRARELVDERDAEVKLRIGYGSPASTIVEHADAYDVVVLGSHSGSLIDRILVGNVAESVVRNAPVTVTTVR
ncbi:universal stress protein [Halorubrum gandharaense]